MSCFPPVKVALSLMCIDSFITGRLLIPYMRTFLHPKYLKSELWLIGSLVVEAIRMAERGDASPEDIDTAMELGAGYRESFRVWYIVHV